ncbi:hypothetical protein HMSSN036_86540 [Paenibacillus macerans]|nr:hypothetical protein HMSSN036_86540 [Paenibacillus macerans]
MTMTAPIINGKQVSEEIRANIRQEVEELKTQNFTPGLAVVLVGEDPASQVYVRNKEKPAMTWAIIPKFTVCRLPPRRRSCWRWWTS